MKLEKWNFSTDVCGSSRSFEEWWLSCKRSRPGRLRWDSGNRKKTHRAAGMSDMCLLWGGERHMHRWKVPTPLYTRWTQSQQGANSWPSGYITELNSVHEGPCSRLYEHCWNIVTWTSEWGSLTPSSLHSTLSGFLTIHSMRGCLPRGSLGKEGRTLHPNATTAVQKLQEQVIKTQALPTETARTNCHSVVKDAQHSCRDHLLGIQ